MLIGDFNMDLQVNFADFLIFVRGFGLRDGDPDFDSALDLNGDSSVGFADFLVFVANFGRSVL